MTTKDPLTTKDPMMTTKDPLMTTKDSLMTRCHLSQSVFAAVTNCMLHVEAMPSHCSHFHE
jgi:hypothetical protein